MIYNNKWLIIINLIIINYSSHWEIRCCEDHKGCVSKDKFKYKQYTN